MGVCHSQRAESTDDKITLPIATPQSNIQCIKRNDALSPFLSVRVVFVSLYQLYQTWEYIPAAILLQSIIVVNGCRQQLLPVTTDDIKLAAQWPLTKLSFSQHFRQFIQCKDRRGLVIWVRTKSDVLTKPINDNGLQRCATLSDRNSISRCQSMSATDVNSFQWLRSHSLTDKSASQRWKVISRQLNSIIDPFTNETYNRLNLSNAYWQTRSISDLHYCQSTVTVWNELSQCSGNHKAMSEIFRDSNASLIPMTRFDSSVYQTTLIALIKSNNDCSEIYYDSTIALSALQSPQQQSSPSSSECKAVYSDLGDIIDENGWHYNE